MSDSPFFGNALYIYHIYVHQSRLSNHTSIVSCTRCFFRIALIVLYFIAAKKTYRSFLAKIRESTVIILSLFDIRCATKTGNCVLRLVCFLLESSSRRVRCVCEMLQPPPFGADDYAALKISPQVSAHILSISMITSTLTGEPTSFVLRISYIRQYRTASRRLRKCYFFLVIVSIFF